MKTILICGYALAGKTTIIKILESLGEKILICDEYIADIYQKGKIGYQLVLKEFGPQYVTQNKVQTNLLADLVFNNQQQLEKLIAFSQPLLRDKIKTEKKRSDKRLFVEAKVAIDYPKYYQDLFDAVWLVETSHAVLAERIKKTNKLAIKKYYKKINYSNYVEKVKERYEQVTIIENNGSISDLIKKVTDHWSQLN